MSALATNFDDLLKAGMAYGLEREKARTSWSPQSATDYNVDFDKSVINFTLPDHVVTAPATMLGAWSIRHGQYLWGWSHPDCPPLDNVAAQSVKAHADAHDIKKLQEKRLECSLDNALQLAAIGLMIGELEGVYRIKLANVYAFIGFGEVTLTQN